MNRDPRFGRMQAQEPEPKPAPAAAASASARPQPDLPPVSEKEKDKRILEMDLSIFGELELPTFKDPEPEDEEEDRMGLPFKPHRVQPVAKEIDASIYSHPVLEYQLQPLELNKPDYTGLVASIPASRIQQDPRLRRYAKKRPLPLEPAVAAATSIEPKSSPVSAGSERPKDPRRKPTAAGSAAQSSPSQRQQQQSGEPQGYVYNPKNDLYSSKPNRPEEFGYSNRAPQEDVYSPTQGVQDMYGSYHRGRSQGPREDDHNARQAYYDGGNDWNEQEQGYGGNNRNWGNSNNWSGSNSHPDQGYYDEPPAGPPEYYDNYRGHRGGMMGGPPRGGPGGPIRNADPPTHRRDPRRRD